MDAFVKDLYWIPKSLLDMTEVHNNYIITLSETDDETIELDCFKEKTIKGKKYIGLPKGDPKKVQLCLLNPKDFKKIKNQETTAPTNIPLKFNGNYRDYQVKAIAEMSLVDKGILQAMPRTGKCVGGKTLIPTSMGYFRIEDLPIKNWYSEDKAECYCEPSVTMYVPTKRGYSKVRSIYCRPNVETYLVKTDMGYIIQATDDERFWCKETNGWVKLKDLTVGQPIKIGTTTIYQKPRNYLYNDVSLNDTKLLGYLFGCKRLNSNTWIVRCNNSVRAHINHLIKDKNYKWKNNLLILDDPITKWFNVMHMPTSVLAGSPETLRVFLKALYEIQFKTFSHPVNEWELRTPSLAIEVQNILVNAGIICKRKANVLLFSDIRNVYSFLGFTYSAHLIDYVPNKPYKDTARVISVTKYKTDTVYDLVVGDKEDDHNFVANGLLVHNTIMGTGLIIEKQQKTLILAHQTDLIEQFCNETINSKDGSLFNGATFKKPIAKICKSYNDFKDAKIALATYQTFLSDKGQALLEKIKDMFGLILIDEVHRTPAERYAQVISKFSARYMYGLTATPDRKDAKYPLVDCMIGRVAHNVKAKSLSARVSGIIYRGPKSNHKTWNGMMSHLFNDEKRNALIAKKALSDVARGHTVLIPVTQHAHAASIAKLISLYSGKNDICFMFTGQIPKNKRQWARDEMNNNPKIKIVIAMRSMLTGVNIPRWSAIITAVPISNEPQYTQEVFRVCTPMEGKRTPVIRFIFDTGLGASYGCLRTCLKTLLKEENQFHICKSFKRVIDYRPTTDVHKSEETFKQPYGGGLRF